MASASTPSVNEPTSLRKIGNLWYNEVAIVHSEKTRLKNVIMIISMINRKK